jgi:hypothetical protein
MKTKTTLVLFLCFFAFAPAFSQKDSIRVRLFALKTDILVPLFGLTDDIYTGSVTFEKGFSSRHSIQVKVMYAYAPVQLSSAYTSASFANNYSLLIFPEYKYFLNKDRMYAGWFSGIYLKLLGEKYEDELYWSNPLQWSFFECKTYDLGGGPIIGYQNYYRHFTYEFLLGIGYRATFYKKILRDSMPPSELARYSNLDLDVAIQVGYRF